MASQTVSAAKRYRISLLLDVYSELLTEKQRTFLRHYFEEDLSFGEIAKEYGVSRQAIFDSVKHGEESLETFERVLKLVDSGWARWIAAGRTAEGLAARLDASRARLANPDGFDKDSAFKELDGVIAELRGELAEDDEDESPAPAPVAALRAAGGGGNGTANV